MQVSTPIEQAARLRGGLVGACSALTAAVAHTAAGAAAPSSSPVVVLVMVCTAIGAAVGGLRPQARAARSVVLIAALGLGQLLGHLVLTVTGSHHHAASMFTASMVALHIVAAVGLGLLIGAVEYLYVVCASVLCWLRVFILGRISPVGHAVWWPSDTVVARPVLLRAGLGMRAPPVVCPAGV